VDGARVVESLDAGRLMLDAWERLAADDRRHTLAPPGAGDLRIAIYDIRCRGLAVFAFLYFVVRGLNLDAGCWILDAGERLAADDRPAFAKATADRAATLAPPVGDWHGMN